MTDSGPEPTRTRWTSTLRTRLPTMFAEAISVVFAVLVALGVDEWWEQRENEELGRRGMDAVAAEIRGNLEELRNGVPEVDTMLARLDSAMARFDSGRENVDLSINYPVALLSDAAWETAQVTRAVHFVPLEGVIRVARVYDLQEFVARNQDALVEQISTMGLGGEEEIERGLRELRGRYRGVAGYRQALMNTYTCALATLAGHQPASQEDCEDLAGG